MGNISVDGCGKKQARGIGVRPKHKIPLKRSGQRTPPPAAIRTEIIECPAKEIEKRFTADELAALRLRVQAALR